LAGRLDEMDFSKIVNETKGIVLSAIEKNLAPRFSHAIDDVAQETYMRAYRSLINNKFRGDSALSTWLYTIARNESLRMNKKLSREEEKSEKSKISLLEPDNYSDSENELELIREKLDLLPEKYRDILKLMSMGDGISEISLKLKIRPGTVKSRASRGRKMLKTMIMEGTK